MFVQSSNTLTDVTSNYTFTDFTFTLNQNPETAGTLTVTVNDATLNTNSDKSYKVNANVFSQNTETYTGIVNTTASPEITMDCDLCEEKITFGTSGVCDLDQGLCICPDGYTGIDEFNKFTSCHVNEKLFSVIHSV